MEGNLFNKPNYFTSSLGGIFTAFSGLIADHNRNNPVFMIITALIFFGSILYFVVGKDFINERNKLNGIKTFIFPSSKEDFVVLSRVLVWLLSAGVIIFLKSNFIK